MLVITLTHFPAAGHMLWTHNAQFLSDGFSRHTHTHEWPQNPPIYDPPHPSIMHMFSITFIKVGHLPEGEFMGSVFPYWQPCCLNTTASTERDCWLPLIQQCTKQRSKMILPMFRTELLIYKHTHAPPTMQPLLEAVAGEGEFYRILLEVLFKDQLWQNEYLRLHT